jgi:hypothetical protein
MGLGAGAAESTLWQIGGDSQGSSGFALGPRGYREYRADGFFVAGRSDAKQDWPYVHPGPDDAWAGSRSHSFEILFALKSVPRGGGWRLVVDFADTHSFRPPKLRACLNGHTWEVQTPAGAGEASIKGEPGKGKVFTWSLPLTSDMLSAGDNELTLSSVAGSWCVYKSVRLEVPEGVVAMPVSERTWLAEVELPPVWLKGDGQELQPIKVTACHTGRGVQAAWKLGKAVLGEVAIRPGVQTFELRAPARTKTQRERLSATSAGITLAETNLLVGPPPIRELWVLPHSHVDIGYTHRQSEVADLQSGNLVKAMELAQDSAANPEGMRFKWNPEAVWSLEQYLRDGSAGKRQALVESVKASSVGVDALYANLLTGLCRPEELAQGLSFGLKFSELTGVPVRSASICDVPGYTWGVVDMMSQAGVKYFAIGPNLTDRVGDIHRWDDKPFYWKSQSGKDRVLCWVVDNYWHHGDLESEALGQVRKLIRSKFPYDIGFMWWVGRWPNGSVDNAPPDEQTVAKVQTWNAKYAAPQIRIGLAREFFARFEKVHGGRLPEYAGDLTPYWEDGAGSTARETGMNRASADRLAQASALYAMRRPPAGFPAARFEEAWRNVLLYTEHTWGAWCSISRPDDAITLDQWKVKGGFAEAASTQSQALLADALPKTDASEGVCLEVYNTTQWPRTDLVTVPAGLDALGERAIVDEQGRAALSQRLASGERVFLAREVPPFGARRYRFATGGSAEIGDGLRAAAQGNVLESGYLKIQIDPVSGAVRSLRFAGVKQELVDAKSPVGLNDFRYVLGTNAAGALSNRPVSLSVLDAGPLVAAIRIRSAAPGCEELIRDVRVVAGINRVEFVNQVNRRSVREKDAVHFGFGFNVLGATLRMETPWAVVRPNKDQLPGSCRNWYTVQRWVDLSASDYGVTWAPLDAPLMEIGGMTANLLGSVNLDEWMTNAPESDTIYSWAQNNHWHTNYKIDQPGLCVFRYVIQPHAGGYSAAESARFGQETSRPLLAAVVKPNAPLPAPLLKLSSQEVIVETVKPCRDGRGLIVRLYGVSEKDSKVGLSWGQKQPSGVFTSDLTERPLAPVKGGVAVPRHGVVTLRAEF